MEAHKVTDVKIAAKFLLLNSMPRDDKTLVCDLQEHPRVMPGEWERVADPGTCHFTAWLRKIKEEKPAYVNQHWLISMLLSFWWNSQHKLKLCSQHNCVFNSSGGLGLGSQSLQKNNICRAEFWRRSTNERDAQNRIFPFNGMTQDSFFVFN